MKCKRLKIFERKRALDYVYAIGAFLLTALFLLLFYQNQGFYPFGDGTISWCDMNQQVVPLLLNFKDIISGQGNVLYSFQNAGGMNFWGVLFFFVASPFSFLTLLVDKSQMLVFMNVLVLLKLATSAWTATFYFRRAHRSIRPEYALLLGMLYAFCGYGLLFYQNIMWLDVMALFPLLLLSLERLFYEERTFPYILAISASIAVNYYLGYMVALFVLLYVGLMLLAFPASQRKPIALRFLAGTAVAALLTAVIWLPCFLQYLSSGRDISFLSSLQSSEFFAPLETTLSILFPSACSLVIMLYGLLHSPVERGQLRTYLLLFLLLFVPLMVEPVNKMWHTGNYQGFPVRYGFMLIFIQLCASAQLMPGDKETLTLKPGIKTFVLPLLLGGLLLAYALFASSYVQTHLETLSSYTSTLWGDMDSLEALFVLFLISSLLFLFIYRCLYRRLMTPRIFLILSLLLVWIDASSNTQVYMFSADYDGHNAAYEQAVDLQHFTPVEAENNAWYRVKLHQKYFDVNLVGGLGFPSLSHYTSLTSQDYMFAMKKLGYSSYWMEVGGYGGTLLSDALLGVAYEIKELRDCGPRDTIVYENDTYAIVQTPASLGLGLLTSEDLSDTNDLDALTRFEVQELLFEKLFPGSPSPFQQYEHDFSYGMSIESDAYDQYQLQLMPKSETGYLYYEIEVDAPQALYFDCFDQLSNRLTEHINGSFTVYVNGLTVDAEYPSQRSNGLLYLGTFEDETVSIEVQLLQSVTCRSFGVFGIDTKTLSEALLSASAAQTQAETLSLTASSDRRIEGFAQTQDTRTVFLAIPYDSGWSLTIDGESASLTQAFLGFSSFTLPAGSHEIALVYTPPGFMAGLLLSLLGLGLLIFAMVARQKLTQIAQRGTALQTASVVLCFFLLFLVIAFVYLFPVGLYLVFNR